MYPSLFVLAKLSNRNHALINKSNISLDDSFKNYFDSEFSKSTNWKQILSNNESVVVYGYGDNFFRAASPKGPLFGLKIEAIIDRNWENLTKNNPSIFNFVDLDTAINKYSSLSFIVTVSWDSKAIVKELKNKGVEKIYLL